VNHGNATGKEILDLANRIRQSVVQKFGVSIEPEVNIIGENPHWFQPR
jgi:UDP-N-acetylmuramate dehydrogenase